MGYLGTKPANSPLTSELIPDGLINTSDLSNGAVTLEKMSQKMTLGTAVSASGTSIDFTGIPSWVKRVTVNFNGLSTNGTSVVQIQIGAGSVTTSGYASNVGYVSNTSALNNGVYTSGFVILNGVAAAFTYNGVITINLLGSNTWCQSGLMGLQSGGNANFLSAGSIALGGTLDRIRITTANGTDTFDAGTINIIYEG